MRDVGEGGAEGGLYTYETAVGQNQRWERNRMQSITQNTLIPYRHYKLIFSSFLWGYVVEQAETG